MLVTFLRTQVGLDETVFFRYLLAKDIQFQNFDDTTFANFRASSVMMRLVRKMIRVQLTREMACEIEAQVRRNGISTAFIFNGRGFNQAVVDALSAVDKIIWYVPDCMEHTEHSYIEKVATKIICTKPRAFNKVRFKDPRTREKVMNINPTLFSTEAEKRSFTTVLEVCKPVERIVEIAFLGNYSSFKENTLVEIARLLRRKIYVVGAGWKSKENIMALGPIYGPHLKQFFSTVKVAIAISDSSDGVVDPITVRYFQYPVLGTLGVFFRNGYNREIFGSEMESFCFENLVEARDRIEAVLGLDENEYHHAMLLQARFVSNQTSSAEQIMQDWVL
jgi:hypothetical protein